MDLDIRIWLIIVGLVVILIVILFVYAIYKKIVRYFRSKNLENLERGEIKKRWNEIEGLLDKKNAMSYKLAVLEADKLFDLVLKNMYFPGSDMGERLKAACYKYSELRKIWWPHKIRNQIVHESTYEINYKTAKAAIDAFKKGLEELGVL